MNDIKVGEYCRTKDGYLAKLIEIEEEIYEFDGHIRKAYGEPWSYICIAELKQAIKSHSENIIDLIEEGDFVNGSEVINITEAKRMNHNLPIVKVIEIERDYGMMEEYEPTQVLEHEIETIVTHEQFNSIKYVLGGREE